MKFGIRLTMGGKKPPILLFMLELLEIINEINRIKN